MNWCQGRYFTITTLCRKQWSQLPFIYQTILHLQAKAWSSSSHPSSHPSLHCRYFWGFNILRDRKEKMRNILLRKKEEKQCWYNESPEQKPGWRGKKGDSTSLVTSLFTWKPLWNRLAQPNTQHCWAHRAPRHSNTEYIPLKQDLRRWRAGQEPAPAHWATSLGTLCPHWWLRACYA